MKVGAKWIIGITISLILIGILLPIGLADLLAYNGTYTYANGSVAGVNATMGTLVGTIIPILFVITLIMSFISFKKRD